MANNQWWIQGKAFQGMQGLRRVHEMKPRELKEALNLPQGASVNIGARNVVQEPGKGD